MSAATGTCGTAPVQVDWSLVAANHQPPPATLVLVDWKQNQWEDTVSVVGTDGGTPVNLGLSDFFFLGRSTTYLGINTVRGVSEAPGGSNAGNVDVSYPAPVDRVVITYSDVTSWTKKQFIGIHDLRWC